MRLARKIKTSTQKNSGSLSSCLFFLAFVNGCCSAPVKSDFFINKVLLLFGSRKKLDRAAVKVSEEHKRSHILQHDRNTLLKFFSLPSFTNTFNLILYSLFFPELQNTHSNAPNFKPKPNWVSFFKSKIEPSHQNNLDTTKNGGRKKWK